MSLMEMLVAIGLCGIVMTIVGALFVLGFRSFAGLGNYAMLSGQSRLALDLISEEVRAATEVLAANTNLPVKSLTLTNSVDATATTFTWDSSTGVLTSDKTWALTGTELFRTNLMGCDDWGFCMFLRSPKNNWAFYPTVNPALCKQLSMSWTCSRTIVGQKINTESSVSAEFVLRNKP
jgi:Tfp pilus assembly protein PilW